MDDWRRIDIDQYDPENQFEEEPLGYPSLSHEQLQPLISSIRSYISKGATGEGLKEAISSPPYGSSDDVKSSYLIAVLELLTSVSQSEIPNILKTLNQDELDILIKIIYGCMKLKEGQKQGGSLLAWYDKTVAITGTGAIVRYLSDVRTL